MKKTLSILLALVLVASLTSLAPLASSSTGTGGATVLPDDPESEAQVELVGGELEVIDLPEADPDLSGIVPGTKKLNFGVRMVQTGAAAYYATTYEMAQTDAAYVSANEDHQEEGAYRQKIGVVVRDARGDDGKWTLSVKASQFMKGGTTPSLANAQIGLQLDGSVQGGGSNEPSANTITLDASSTGPAEVILKAHADGSVGRWGANYGALLKLKAGTSTAGNHQATLTWSLTAGI